LLRISGNGKLILPGMREIFITNDLRSYAYTVYYQVSSLFESEEKP